MKIPMSSPDIAPSEIEAVAEILRDTQLSRGPRIAEFEERLAERAHRNYGCAVSSGTAGLHLAVLAAGVEPGSLVLTTPFSFVASSNVVLFERGIPVFVDVDPETGNLDPNQVAAAVEDLTGLSRTPETIRRRLPPALRTTAFQPGPLKALLAVHVFGQPADMDALRKATGDAEVAFIEDACEAVGARYKGRPAGSLGDAGVFAFYPNKQLTTGEGGMIVTDRKDWWLLFRSLRNQGRDPDDSWLIHGRLGYNYRMDELSAALGLAQLGRFDDLLERRRRVAEWYNERLADCEGVEIPKIASTTTFMSWFVYVVRILEPLERDGVQAALAEQGIPSRPYFGPIHLQPFYRSRFGYREGDFPVTERLGKVSLALPFSGVMTKEQVDYVCRHLRRIVADRLRRTRAGTA